MYSECETFDEAAIIVVTFYQSFDDSEGKIREWYNGSRGFVRRETTAV